MTAVDLEPLDAAFHGVIPAALATSAANGMPHVISISHVYRVDREHVAVSDQFMRRTRENLETNGRAELQVVDPTTGRQHRLTAVFVRSESEGPTFQRMAATIEGVAAATGMAKVFALRGALVLRVTAVLDVAVDAPAAGDAKRPPPRGLSDLVDIASHLRSSNDLALFARRLLEQLERSLGFAHSKLLLVDEGGAGLFTFESRGYAASGVGSDVRVGEGLLGMCAERLVPVRIASLAREVRYARAAHASDEIPLPGLPNAESLLAVPLLVRDALVGLLVVESPAVMAFSGDDERMLSLIGRLAAPDLHAARADAREDAARPAAETAVASDAAPVAARYYEVNDSVFIDDTYIVKGVPGRILWILLSEHIERGRTAFANRELRLDPRLGLAGYRDNLEARLLLLRRRLAEMGAPLALPSTGRGRFRLDITGKLALEQVAAPRSRS